MRRNRKNRLAQSTNDVGSFGVARGDEKMKYAALIVCICTLPGVANAGLTNAQRKSQFERALGAIIASAAPQIFTSARERLIAEYLAGKGNRALAFEPSSRRFFRSPSHEDEAVAAERALESCQLLYEKPCALLAVNEEIAAEGELVVKDMPRLQYAESFDLSKIPIIRPAVRNRLDVQNYRQSAEPKAIAIHPWGRLFTYAGATNVKDAQEIVLAKCNNDQDRNGRDGRCFLYAVNNDVVLSERRMVSK